MSGHPVTLPVYRFDLLYEQLALHEHALTTDQHALWRWHRPSDNLFLSKQKSSHFGTPDEPGPLTLTKWKRRIHPSDAASVKLQFETHLRHNTSFEQTFRIGTDTTGWTWVRVTSTVMDRDQHGKAINCMGLIQNVNEPVQTRRLLAQAESHFNHALKTANCSFWVWNMQTNTIDVRIHKESQSNTAPRIISSALDAIRCHVFDEDKAVFDATISRYHEADVGIVENSWRIQNQPGGYRWILNRGEVVEQDGEGRPTMAMGTQIDISNQKETELDLKHKTKLLSLANENTLDSLWDWNLHTQKVYMSPNWFRSMGFATADDVSMKELMALVHPQDRHSVSQTTKALLEGDIDDLQLEYRIKLNNCGWIWVLVRGHIVERDVDQNVSRVVGTLADITTLKLQSMRLKRKEEQLELAMVGSNNSLFDYNLVTGNYQIHTYKAATDGVDENIYQFDNHKLLTTIHPNDIHIFHRYLNHFKANEPGIHTTRWRSRLFGEDYRWIETKGRVVERSRDGLPTRIVGTRQDIHEQVLAEQQASLEHQRLQLAFKGTGDALWDMDIQNGSVFVSASWIEDMGYGASSWRPDMRHWAKLIHPEDKPAAKAALKAHFAGKAPSYIAEYRVKTKNNEWLWLLARGHVIKRDIDGNPARAVGTLFNIGRQKQIEAKLASAKELAETTLHSIADAVITTDQQGRVISMNQKAEKLLGQSLEMVANQPLGHTLQLIDEDSNETVGNPALFCITADLTVELEKNILLRNQQGEQFSVHCKASPIHSSDQKPIGAVLIMQDVTASRNLSREIEHRSKHDSLTNLINRYEFESRLNELIESASPGPHALCYLDLDQFKIVNDTCGHTAGDELLRQLSTELSRVVRQSDSLGRLGGDEFALLMENCNLNRALEVAENILEAVGNFSFGWEDKQFNLGVSIGLVSIEQHSNPQLVLQHADSACFVAKEQGRNRIHIHQDGDDQIALRQGEMGWIPRIQRALDQNLFVLYAQAIVNLQQPGTPISHFELLLRMRYKDKLVPPGAFLPAAERYNLSSKLDQWVIRHTLTTLKDTFDGKPSPVDFNINLSANSLNEPGFLEFCQHQITESGVVPGNLCFEITETAAISNLTAASQFIDCLTQMGCRFALDDFGSGLSSFAYLKNFPVDFLKIDGSFVKDLVDDPIDAAMVKSINEIGHIMNKKTVAEWVENQAIADQLVLIGVNYAQGYHFSVPEPFDTALLKIDPVRR